MKSPDNECGLNAALLLGSRGKLLTSQMQIASLVSQSLLSSAVHSHTNTSFLFS